MPPQIRCPNCGTTINSENRRKIDFGLILSAVQKKPRSFTELLKMTKLPRKTLALRLRALIDENALTKDKLYYLNGKVDPEITHALHKNLFHNKKRILLAFALLIMIIPTGIQVYAILTSPPPPPPPQIKGLFDATLYVDRVEDLYAWEAVINYDSENTKIVNIIPGWLSTEFPFFVNATIPEFELLLVGNLLFNSTSGKSGSGVLATIIFAYYCEDYELPQLLPDFEWYHTKLWNSNKETIDNGILRLDVKPLP